MDNGESSYRRFLNGDKSGFDELIAMYREPLILFINGFLHNLVESEDVAEDVFVELIVHPKRFLFRSSLKTYIFSIAKNKAMDVVRREIKISFDIALSEFEKEDEMRVEDHICRKENEKILLCAMEKLHPEYAAVLRLIYFEDMTNDEAGKVLGKNKRQMANLLYRAKNSLRCAMKEEGFTYEE